ncbi:hypothetical protein [Streptomyces sp. YIM B13518]
MRGIRAEATGAVVLSPARAASARGGGPGTGGGSDTSPAPRCDATSSPA